MRDLCRAAAAGARDPPEGGAAPARARAHAQARPDGAEDHVQRDAHGPHASEG